MPDQIAGERFAKELLMTLNETFESVHGLFLDKGTSLFETLATITAEEASRPVSTTCATLAAQVEHTRFYLDLVADHMEGIDAGKVDWGEIWRTVSAVTPDEWAASKTRLDASYRRVVSIIKTRTWEHEDALFDAFGILAHTAYHLGEIRQALCTIKAAG
ncbi:MAG: hypothetical protein KC519_03245 [Anaerolineae bacterium]|nr:hypothetical protein [Anaerolineae bacterium]